MTSQRRRLLLQASIPAILVHSAVAAGSVVCKNDKDDHCDSGCTSENPICVTSENEIPPTHQEGDKCVPCVNYYESPTDPDWGCSASEPLCVDREGNRPEPQTAGASCAPYPCYNTSEGQEPDQGCTPSQPICVDGLEKEPLQGKPGIKCISSTRYYDAALQPPTAFSTEPIPAFGLSSYHENNNSQSDSKTSDAAACFEDTNAGQFSFCNGCPFGTRTAQVSRCDIQKLSW